MHKNLLKFTLLSAMINRLYVKQIKEYMPSLWNYIREMYNIYLIILEPSCEMNKWPNSQNKLCRSWKVIDFCSWQLFHLKSSCQQKLCLNLKKFKFKFKFNFENDLERKNHQHESCRYRRVMKLCSWQCFGLKSSCHAKLCLNFEF